MGVTSTLHYVCDRCGKRADVEYDHASNHYPHPAGWANPSDTPDWGTYCSEPCYLAVLVDGAQERAARAFELEKAGEPR